MQAAVGIIKLLDLHNKMAIAITTNKKGELKKLKLECMEWLDVLAAVPLSIKAALAGQ